ncbi:hypothetical protein ACTA71_004440 [Dictyostelium dimigraforme]
MKIIILLISIFHLLNIVNVQGKLKYVIDPGSQSSSEEIPKMKFKTWQFKPDRNIDFGLDLFSSSDDLTPNIFKNYLDTISNPTFCCGDTPVASTNDPSTIVAHGESTVNQWFADAPYGTVDDSQCPSYRVDIPFQIFYECPTCPFGEIRSEFFSYSDIGFNNQTLFNYDNEVDQGLFCFETHFSFKYNEPIPTDARLPVFAHLTVESPGEIWAFIDNQLVIDKGGIGFDEDQPFGEGLVLGEDNLPHTANIFGCQRMDDVDQRVFSVTIYTNNIGIFCNYVDECGFCEGDGVCREQCFDVETSCSQKRTLCGTCVEADRDCDDGDICTLDFCTEGTGCEHSYITGCRCDESYCNTTDLCFPKHCDENLVHCITEPVECPPSEECPNAFCLDGACFCGDITTTTSVITSEVTTTTATSFPTTSTTTGLTTLNPTTSLTISPTTTTATTTSSPSTTTSSTTFIPTTTTDLTTVSHTTELSTIYSSTIGTTSSTTTSGSTLPPRPIAECYENIDCPPNYCCFQISKYSYTCISKYFEDQCFPDRLKIF